jgi:quercetin dioxygenase-like cupin family protein
MLIFSQQYAFGGMMKKILGIVILFLTTSVFAEDAVKVCPNMFKVIAENETTRVIKFTQKKGESCPMHTHGPLAVYVIKPGKLTYIMPDGTKKEGPKLKAGDAFLRPATEHEHAPAGAESVAILVETK